MATAKTTEWSAKPPKKVLAGVNITAVEGDYGNQIDVKAISYISQCLGANWFPKLESKVTHLICTRQLFEHPNEIMQAAIAKSKSKKGLHILPYEWLNIAREKRTKEPESHYAFGRHAKERKIKKERRHKIMKKKLNESMQDFDMGKEMAREDLMSGEFSNPAPDQAEETLDEYSLQFVNTLRSAMGKECYDSGVTLAEVAADPESLATNTQTPLETKNGLEEQLKRQDEVLEQKLESDEPLEHPLKPGKMPEETLDQDDVLDQTAEREETKASVPTKYPSASSSAKKSRAKHPARFSDIHPIDENNATGSRYPPRLAGQTKDDYQRNLEVLVGGLVSLDPPPKKPPSDDEQRLVRWAKVEQFANKDLKFPDKYHLFRTDCADPPPDNYANGPELFALSFLRTYVSENRWERILLRLYESDSVPPTYAVYAMYPENVAPGEQLAVPPREISGSKDYQVRFAKSSKKLGAGYILVQIGSSWLKAKKVWDEEFKRLTGWSWRDRFKASGEWPEELQQEREYRPFKWQQLQRRH